MDNFFVNMLLILYNNIKCTTMQFMKIISTDSKISGSKIRFFFSCINQMAVHDAGVW